MEESQNKSDFTMQFRVGGFVIHIAGIFHLSGSVQNKKLSKSLDGPPFASSTKCTSTRDRITAGSDKAYFLFNKKNYYGFL
jgi:hypothetical protein